METLCLFNFFFFCNGKHQLQSHRNSKLKHNTLPQHFDKWPLQRWSSDRRNLCKCWERFESRREKRRQTLQEAREEQRRFCSGEVISWKGKSSSPGLCGLGIFREWTIKGLLNVYLEFLSFDQLLSRITGSFFTVSSCFKLLLILQFRLWGLSLTKVGFHYSWVFAFTWGRRGHVLFKGLATCLKCRKGREAWPEHWKSSSRGKT